MSDAPLYALGGVKIVDLSRVLSGPFCTQILGDHGANIIKVEPPNGDEVRQWGPPFARGMASYFIGVNRNKRSISIDLRTEAGREVLLKLLEDADVLIENYKPGTMEKWGLGYADLQDRYPKLIYCRISGFGEDGPFGSFPGYDAILQAMCGLMSINGEPESEGVRMGIPVIDLTCGLYATIAIAMGLIEREASQQGQFIDMALYDTAFAILHPYLANYLLSGDRPGTTGNAHPNISPYDKFPTRTCEIFLGIGNDRAFARLCTELGVPEVIDDKRFQTNADRVANREALRSLLVELLARHDGKKLCQRLLGAGLAAGPVLPVDDAFNQAHTKFRDLDLEDGWYRGVGSPLKFSRSRTTGVTHHPPAHGQHSREILAEHGFSEGKIEDLLESGAVLDGRA